MKKFVGMNILSFHTIIDPWQQGRIMLAKFNSWGGAPLLLTPVIPAVTAPSQNYLMWISVWKQTVRMFWCP